MNHTEVMALLEANRNERGIQNWQKLGDGTGGLTSYGIGLTQLRKLAKQVGRDRDLARTLWESEVSEAKVIALLVDDPEQMTRDQAERQVEELGSGMLAHVFSSCDATLAKAPFVLELADEWVKSEDRVRRSCGYGLLYEISKFGGKKAPDDDYFLDHIAHVRKNIDDETSSVRMAMALALMGIGKRNAALNAAALEVARAAGPIENNAPGESCEPFDVTKHLTTDRLKKKLGI